MTPEQEIEKIKKSFADQWAYLGTLPDIQKALDDKNPIRLGELAQQHGYGNYGTQNSAARRLSKDLRKTYLD